MGQGVCADYGVFCVLLDSCVDSKPLQVCKSVNGFLKCSLSIWSDLAPLLCINPPGFKLRGLSLCFLKLMCVSRDYFVSFLKVD